VRPDPEVLANELSLARTLEAVSARDDAAYVEIERLTARNAELTADIATYAQTTADQREEIKRLRTGQPVNINEVSTPSVNNIGVNGS
jgi:hypothetical protein